MLFLVLIEIVNDSCWSVSTDPLILVAITITTLSKRLIAVHASVGPRTSMGTHVIHDVAELVELFLAGQALQNLIKPTCLSVHNLSFSVSFIFADHISHFSFFLPVCFLKGFHLYIHNIFNDFLWLDVLIILAFLSAR